MQRTAIPDRRSGPNDFSFVSWMPWLAKSAGSYTKRSLRI